MISSPSKNAGADLSEYPDKANKSKTGLFTESAPLPREHGAWVILYAPIVITLASTHIRSWINSVLLIVVVTGLFLGRNAAALLIRKRGNKSTAAWLRVYLAIACIGIIPLMLTPARDGLLFIGALAIGLFAVHTLLILISKHGRLDRSQWGEMLSVGALALTAPAAYVAGTGYLDPVAWCLWASCALYFGSGIFFVKMLLNAIKIKGEFDWGSRWRTGRDNIVYHILLLFVIVGVSQFQRGLGAALAVVAYLPAVIRAVWGFGTLSNVAPSFKRVGWGETFYSLWFTCWFIASLRVQL